MGTGALAMLDRGHPLFLSLVYDMYRSVCVEMFPVFCISASKSYLLHKTQRNRFYTLVTQSRPTTGKSWLPPCSNPPCSSFIQSLQVELAKSVGPAPGAPGKWLGCSRRNVCLGVCMPDRAVSESTLLATSTALSLDLRSCMMLLSGMLVRASDLLPVYSETACSSLLVGRGGGKG
ncbi:hypothetical protein HJG60_010298 [Phyllostomus discolor]|uniref:Uncharacterized protein n=1 Tax=Phyllostomus discolor TaxID=89673 RepID=A0A834AWH1_9CHIR|nr:hypothetical protein HJG60_010298 [Phyllostomus discolor]